MLPLLVKYPCFVHRRNDTLALFLQANGLIIAILTLKSTHPNLSDIVKSLAPRLHCGSYKN